MGAIDTVMKEVDEKMAKSLHVLHEQLQGVRTGKASPEFVENVAVTYYGTPTRLRDLANISTPETRLIVIHPYDPTSLSDIEKGILAANLGVTPMNDGRVVRVPIPELNEERRRELVKVVRRMCEEARVAVRNVRRDGNEQLKKLHKDGKVTEDERDGSLEQIQKRTDKCIAKVDEIQQAKEKDLMAV